MRWASGKCCAQGRRAGVAMTTSPIQFGRKTAIVHGSHGQAAPQPLQNPRGRKALAQRRQVDPAAVGFDEVGADHLVLAVVRPLDQHVRPQRSGSAPAASLVEDRDVIDRLQAGQHLAPRRPRLTGRPAPSARGRWRRC